MNEIMKRNERRARMEQRNSTYELGYLCVIWNSAVYEPGSYLSCGTDCVLTPATLMGTKETWFSDISQQRSSN